MIQKSPKDLRRARSDEETITDIGGIIKLFDLSEEFSCEILAEAKHVAKPASAQEIARRMDLRGQMLITIDPEDAKDLDDAVSLVKNDDGTYELGVHIADVAHYVKEGSLLDGEAFTRGTSVYFPNMCLPMLPPQLSNNICSLQPNSDRLAMSVFMTIDRTGEVIKHKIAESIINIHTRFNYYEVQDILDGDQLLRMKHKDVVPMLEEMAILTQVIESVRRKRGEVAFEVPEPKIILDDDGKICDVVAYPHYLSHRIIETFMIICNEVVAKIALDKDLPFVYRIHDKPDPLKVGRLVETLRPFKINHKINPAHPTGQAYQKMIDRLDESIKPIISQLCLRSMQKAKYSPQCIGHFGLGAKYYCHFTSPIRRYPDLVIHRILKMLVNKQLSSQKIEQLRQFVDEASEQSSKTELTATEAEREADNLKRAEYMAERIGEKFTGTVTGILNFGVFVYLPNTVEGLIKIENMPRDNYSFNEKQSTLVGRKYSFKMGDKIDVICVGVNLARRQVEFSAMTR